MKLKKLCLKSFEWLERQKVSWVRVVNLETDSWKVRLDFRVIFYSKFTIKK
jgi:hypothetical protein